MKLELKDILLIVLGLYSIMLGYRYKKMRSKALEQEKEKGLKDVKEHIKNTPLSDLVDQSNKEFSKRD